ncbi:mandelate racemase/muconate lactonizing enzyme family protein [Chloroflexota bacterium]
MKITNVEPIMVVGPVFEKPFWTSLNRMGRINELVVRVYTSEGIVGIGEAHVYGIEHRHTEHATSPQMGRDTARLSDARVLVTEGLKPLLVGEDPLDTERLWSKMFTLTYKRGWAQSGWNRQLILGAIGGVDIALWDIKGKAANMPVYKLLGGYRNRVPCYVTGGYYQEGKTNSDLVRECESYVDMGYNAIKLKVGGLSVEEDVARVRTVREALGPDIDIMLDVNEAYDVPTAIRAARAFEPLGIRWLEEPVHWYDRVEGLRQVAEATSIPIASGEQTLNRWEARDLVLRGGIKLMQFDCTRAAGVTEWLKVAGMCAAQNVRMAPHHDPQIHGHLVAAVPNGEILETFPDSARDPIWAELFSVRPDIKGGELELLDRPGWGLELDEKTLERRGLPA